MDPSRLNVPRRYFPSDIQEKVQDVIELRESLVDTELGWPNPAFWKDEIENMERISGKSFFFQQEEIDVYLELRAAACIAEETIFDLMYGRKLYSAGPAMEEWKWIFYREILEHVRKLSVIGRCPGDCESGEDTE